MEWRRFQHAVGQCWSEARAQQVEAQYQTPVSRPLFVNEDDSCGLFTPKSSVVAK